MFEQHAKLMDTCSSCPRLCQSACPVAMTDGNEAHSPWGLMQTLNLVRKGAIPFDEEVAAKSYQCLTCRACTQLCEHENVIPPVLLDARREAVRSGMAPAEINGFLAKFHRYNNPFARDLLQRLRQLVTARLLEADSRIVYYPSCTTIAKAPDVIEDTMALFKKLKIDFVGVYPEPIQCCGYPLYSGGLEEDFVDLAEINFHHLKRYKTIISGSPACVYTMREIYRKYALGLGDRVMTINEFLEPYLHNINFRIKKGIRTKLMYHDPCYASRYLGEIERPREMIAQVSGYQPLEFFRERQTSRCSGQGGCFSIVAHDVSDEIAGKRMAEVVDNNVSLVVTQCPSCIHKFKKNSKNIIIKDVISYLNDCIEGVKD